MVRRTTITRVLPVDAPGAVHTLQMPRGARHLATFLDYQPGLVLHFDVLDDAEDETRRFQVVSAGSAVRSAARYVASVQMPSTDGPLVVLHVYEVRDDPNHVVEVRSFGGGQAWASCSCGWRSSLHHTEAAAQDIADDHADAGR